MERYTLPGFIEVSEHENLTNEFRTSEWRTPGRLVSFQGYHGSGKTTAAIATVIEDYQHGARVFVEEPFNIPHDSDILDARDGVLFLNESYIYLDRRLAFTNTAQCIHTLIMQRRRRNLDVLLVSQPDALDVRIDKQVDFVVRTAIETPGRTIRINIIDRQTGKQRSDIIYIEPYRKYFPDWKVTDTLNAGTGEKTDAPHIYRVEESCEEAPRHLDSEIYLRPDNHSTSTPTKPHIYDPVVDHILHMFDRVTRRP